MANLANINNNPGNLKDPNTGQFRQFSDPLEGKAALYNDLTAKMSGKLANGNLLDFAKTYAPASDNNDPLQYAANLANQLGVSPDTKLGTLSPRIDDFANAIMKNEGYQEQTIKQKQTQQQPQEQGLLQHLGGRVQDIGTAVSQTIGGQINPFSGVLQTAGAVAGGLGDIVGKGLELIPGVKQVENLIGQIGGSLAQTQTGQDVMKSIKDFSTEHPELSKDIGAGFNIVTAIPILKGLGVLKDIALDASGIALKNVAEKSMTNTLTEAVSKYGKTGVRFLNENPNVVKDMVDERIIPDIANNKLSTGHLVDESWSKVGDLNSKVKEALNAPKFRTATEDPNMILQNTLKGFTDRNGVIHSGFPNAGLLQGDIIDTAKSLNPENKTLWDKFFKGQANMSEINTLRSDLDSSVKSVYTSLNEPPFKKDIGANLASAMRDYVQTNAPETQSLFSDMSKHFGIQKALKFMDGKSVKSGLLGTLAREGIADVATLGGEAAGNLAGVPFAGALTSRGIGQVLGKAIPKKGLLTRAILSRTGEGAVNTSLGQAGKGLLNLGGGVGGQKLNR